MLPPVDTDSTRVRGRYSYCLVRPLKAFPSPSVAGLEQWLCAAVSMDSRVVAIRAIGKNHESCSQSVRAAGGVANTLQTLASRVPVLTRAHLTLAQETVDVGHDAVHWSH